MKIKTWTTKKTQPNLCSPSKRGGDQKGLNGTKYRKRWSWIFHKMFIKVFFRKVSRTYSQLERTCCIKENNTRTMLWKCVFVYIIFCKVTVTLSCQIPWICLVNLNYHSFPSFTCFLDYLGFPLCSICLLDQILPLAN